MPTQADMNPTAKVTAATPRSDLWRGERFDNKARETAYVTRALSDYFGAACKDRGYSVTWKPISYAPGATDTRSKRVVLSSGLLAGLSAPFTGAKVDELTGVAAHEAGHAIIAEAHGAVFSIDPLPLSALCRNLIEDMAIDAEPMRRYNGELGALTAGVRRAMRDEQATMITGYWRNAPAPASALDLARIWGCARLFNCQSAIAARAGRELDTATIALLDPIADAVMGAKMKLTDKRFRLVLDRATHQMIEILMAHEASASAQQRQADANKRQADAAQRRADADSERDSEWEDGDEADEADESDDSDRESGESESEDADSESGMDSDEHDSSESGESERSADGDSESEPDADAEAEAEPDADSENESGEAEADSAPGTAEDSDNDSEADAPVSGKGADSDSDSDEPDEGNVGDRDGDSESDGGSGGTGAGAASEDEADPEWTGQLPTICVNAEAENEADSDSDSDSSDPAFWRDVQREAAMLEAKRPATLGSRDALRTLAPYVDKKTLGQIVQAYSALASEPTRRTRTDSGKIDRRRLVYADGRSDVFAQHIDRALEGSLILLLDLSGSTANQERLIKQAGASMYAALKPTPIKVWVYSYGQPDVVQLATPDRVVSFDTVHSDGGTPTAQAFARIVADVKPRGQSVIIHVTDGEPDNRVAAYREMEAAHADGWKVINVLVGYARMSRQLVSASDSVVKLASYRELPAMLSNAVEEIVRAHKRTIS